jgi:hypothetical protein
MFRLLQLLSTACIKSGSACNFVLARTCPKCLGSGMHRFDNGLPTYPETGGVSKCMRCNGQGWLSDEDKDV